MAFVSAGTFPRKRRARHGWSLTTVHDVELARELQIKAGDSIALIGVPADIDVEMPEDVTVVADAEAAAAVLAFAHVSADLDTVAASALVAAREDRLAWIAYPKAGQLGTDLNRDGLAARAKERGVQPVRQVSVDEVWSALRFRPL